MKYLDKVEHRPNGIPDVRYPEKVECRPDRIPPPDDTERASLSGATPSGFPKRKCDALPYPEQLHPDSPRRHTTLANITHPDDSISYPDMLSGSLTKVSKLCYVILTTCHSLRSVALRWCVRTPYPDIFAMDSKELSSISNCFGDQKAIKTPKLNTI